MRTVLLRLKDLFLLCFIISPISCALYYYGVIPNTDGAFCTLLLLASFVFVISNVFMLRKCFCEIADPQIYYVLNYVAYGIFILITVVMYFVLDDVPYAWLFSTIKFLKFALPNISTLFAVVFMHVVMLIVITVAPIGLEWILYYEKEE